MNINNITQEQKEQYNALVTHPLQAYEWGEFRKKTGLTVIRKGFYKNDKLIDGFQLTIHKIPQTPFTIGYLPKGNFPTQELIEELQRIGKEQKCIFIQMEPNIIQSSEFKIQNSKFRIQNSARPLFTRYTFILDLTKSEEQLLKEMHPKTRYNIKVAKKNKVTVEEDNSEQAFEQYLKLTKETTKRQRFYAHSQEYHRLMWNVLKPINRELKDQNLKTDNGKPITENLSAHLLVARYNDKPLVTWIIFVFKDTLYYPYGASSTQHRETMASNLIMWEAIKFGKKLGLKKFDMWGALGPNPNPKDPWYGFHRFKMGYGPELIEFVGSYDLVINPVLYQGYKVADKLRWALLQIKK